ncbi:hypothetical protein T06_3920 [Trichinella sp. T6]|nr:hypothetical protein T06_3920 [Trichinella sp. T6]
MGQDDSPNSHVREEFIKETKSGIYSSVLEAMFSSKVADHRSRDSRMAEALTLGPINCGTVLCSSMPNQWKLAGLIAFQGQPDGYRSLERTNDSHQDETKTTTKSTNSTSTNNPNDLHVVPFLPVAIYTKWVQGVGAYTRGFTSSSAGSGTKRALLSSPDCYNSLRKTSESN